jgi:hypothetical protein
MIDGMAADRSLPPSAALATARVVEREVSYLVDEIFNASATRGVFAYRLLVSRYLSWLARLLVHRARRRGTSWAGIGRVLGISWQAV